MKLLVESYQSNTSFPHIYEGKIGADKSLNWATRLRILVDAGQGMLL